MTPQERMRWFWATGVLPGSIFQDLDDPKAAKTRRWRLLQRRSDRRDAGHENR